MIRIGTRESQLAVWQARLVQQQLEAVGVSAELVYIKSEGDIDLVTPLYSIGVQGVFTRALDAALLSGIIDVAVHSMKDVPTQMAKGIAQAAVLERAFYGDVFVPKDDVEFLNDLGSEAVIATSSVRRRAQWLRRYPNHSIENIRGNVNTRLQRVKENSWKGAIFASAGLERTGLLPSNAVKLNWMLPAPAQGAIVAVCRQSDLETLDLLKPLHHLETGICVEMERAFLSALMGGCTAPISALALMERGGIRFRGNVLSADGKQMLEVDEVVGTENGHQTGYEMGRRVWKNGGEAIIRQIRDEGIKNDGTK